jgi:ribosomal protein L11 methyltransferase
VKTWPALELRGMQHVDADLLQAALTEYDVAAIDDNDADAWRVFFHASEERDRSGARIAGDFPRLACAAVDVPDENWAARSQADLHAIRVGDVVVAPPWDVPQDGIVIIIQPSMGFGTGHHATTRLCLSALQQLDVKGRSVIDVGTGSGVLAIAATRLGATPVVAVDDDADAVQAARENVALNDAAAIDLRTADLRRDAFPAFDVVVANLTGGLLIQAAARLQDLARPGGHLVLSGFMEHEEAEVLSSFNDPRPHLRQQEQEWVCVTLQKR